MIELGDLLREMGNQGWFGIATESTLEEARVAKYDAGIYEGYIGSDVYAHDEIRGLIRDGFFKTSGNVRDAQEGAVRLQAGGEHSYSMDVEATESVYEAVENGGTPDTIETDEVLFWNTHDHELSTVETFGWQDDSLADDLVKFDNGSVESLRTVSQALREGVLVLMTPQKDV